MSRADTVQALAACAVEAASLTDLWNPAPGDKCRLTSNAPEALKAGPKKDGAPMGWEWIVEKKEWSDKCGHMHIIVRAFKPAYPVGFVLCPEALRDYFAPLDQGE